MIQAMKNLHLLQKYGMPLTVKQRKIIIAKIALLSLK